MRKFMPQQIKAFDYAKPLARIALFMEMRLGKTLVVIRWAEFNKCKRILMLAPCSVVPVWEEELQVERWPDEDILILTGSVEERVEQARVSRAPWNLTNYETVTNYRALLKMDWDCIILDESTRIKNPNADITKFLNNDAVFIRCRAILSGLPAPESVLDYYEQMRFLHGRFMHKHNYWWWRKTYFMQIGYDWVPRNGTIKKIREGVSELAFVMTAKEAGLGNRKICEKRYVELNSKQKKIYEQIENDFEYEDKTGKYIMTKYIPVKLGWMQRICGGFDTKENLLSTSKLDEMYELLKSELRKKSIVIWFKHTVEMEYALGYFIKRNFKCAFFNAKTKDGEREFKEGRRQLMLAQAKCGQFGIDWSVADVAMYYSNWWSGEVRAQTEKRIEHPKKKRPLLYLDFLCKDTIDVDVYKALKTKSRTAKRFTEKIIKNWRIRHGTEV